MNAQFLEEALRAVVATNLALQNTIGTYASQSAKTIQLLEGEKFRDARIERIETNLNEIGITLNAIIRTIVLINNRLKIKNAPIRKQKKK